MVPLQSRISLLKYVNKTFITSVNFSGLVFKASEIAVNPLTSQNIIDITLFSPPSFSLSGSSIKLSTMSGDRY